jgi:hypothetical protein
MYNCESNWQATFKTDAINPSTYTSGSDTITTTSSPSSDSTSSSGTPSATSSGAAAGGVGLEPTKSGGSQAGLIAGATIGGIAAIALVGIAILLAIRYSRKKTTATTEPNVQQVSGSGPPGYVEPYKQQPVYYGEQQQHYPQELPAQGYFGQGQPELQGTPVGEMPAGPLSPKPGHGQY